MSDLGFCERVEGLNEARMTERPTSRMKFLEWNNEQPAHQLRGQRCENTQHGPGWS